MKAFVTGGTGFLGTHLVNALLARGDDVTCLVRSPSKAASLERRRVRLIRGDLDDAGALRRGCAGADVIFHLAGRIAARDLNAFMRANRDGTANLLEAAAERPPRRFVYVSSLAAAGPTVPGQPIDETRPPAPVTPYGQSKLAGEVLVRAVAFPWTVVRPPRLINKPLSGEYRTAVGANVIRGSRISRADVAHLMLEALAVPETIRRAVGVAY